jgi:Peptidase family S41/N-terminal domain of Peptidase_S41 in eukaryotic IRBP
MSEKIYACLLRLFPAHFRETYGEAALQLFRDRARDERGLFRTLRLWLDLLADLAISLPGEYRYARPALIGAAFEQRLEGAPSFFVLGDESPRPEALIFGCVLSMVALGMFPTLLGHAGSYRPLSVSADQHQRAADARSSAFRHPTAETANDVQDATIGSKSGRLPAMDARRLKPDEVRSNHSEPNASLPLDSSRFSPAQPLRPQHDGSPMIRTSVGGVTLNAAERQRVVGAVIQNLKEQYVDPDVAQKMADALLAHEKNGDDNTVTDGEAFADRLTKRIRDVSHDMHLEVVYSHNPLPERSTGPSPERMADYRKAMEANNCTFEKVQILSHNVGYLKLNSFPEPSICGTTAKAAMASLNQADAIIFDLRENRGGYPSMVMLIADYLFDHPEYMYRPGETTELCWTRSPVSGNRLADKPVYVLTSARTFSGAEHFSYDLKMLKRATLVGERTAGATDVGVFHRIDDHFGIGIRETRAINPYSEPDWAGIGVDPDVKVKAADALETAEKLAESRLQKK